MISKINMNIQLKLISGSKVVLAECSGYQTELFVPVIVNNQITLQNAVPSRRCCQMDTTKSLKRLSIQGETPLANSTPNHKSNKENQSCTIESFSCPIRKRFLGSNSSQSNISKDVSIKKMRAFGQVAQNQIARIKPTTAVSSLDISSKQNRFPTPDIVRRAPVQINNESIPLPQFPIVTHLKIVPLHRVKSPNIPTNLAKIVRLSTPTNNTTSPKVLRNLSSMSSFGSPPSLQRTNESNSHACHTPNQSFLVRQMKTPGSATKWRKCITPQRTYIRHSNTLARTTSLKPLRLAKNGMFIEDFRYPIKLEKRIIIKRRKLLVDSDVKISPKTFKKQLINTDDLRAEKSLLPKSRRHFYLSHMTAFDLLTNSGFYPKIADKLNSVFRKGCVNKSADTILKYKQLTKDIGLNLE